MVLPAKPVLQRAKTEPKPHSAYTKAEKDHVQVIKSLCKTYKATLTKLTYVFASLGTPRPWRRAQTASHPPR